MADIIGQIVSQEAFNQIQQLKKDLADTYTAFEKLNGQIAKPVKGGTGSNNQQLDEMGKLLNRIITLEEQLVVAKTKEFKVEQELKLQKSDAIRQAKEEIKIQNAAKGSYDQLNSSLNKSVNALKALSAEERKAAKGTELLNHIKKLDRELKDMDATMGKHNRNVGNYSSALSGLKSRFLGLISLGSGLAFLGDQIKQGIGDSRVLEGVKIAFDRLNDPNLLNNLQEATKNTVNNLDLMKAGVQAKNLGVPIKELGALFGFAQQRALETGESVDYLVDSIVKGIGRKSPLILDNLGISAIALKDELGGVAAASASVGQVAEAVGRIIQKSQAESGQSIDESQSKLLRSQAAWENTRTELGKKLLPVITNVTAIFTTLGAVLLSIPLPIIVAGVAAIAATLVIMNRQLIIATARTFALNAAMLRNPFVAVAAGVVALVAGLKKLYDSNEIVKNSFDKLWAAVRSALEAFEPLIAAVQQLGKVLVEKLGPIFTWVINNAIVPFINYGLKQLTYNFKLVAGGISAFVSVFGFAYEQVKKIAGSFVDTLTGVFTLDRDLIAKGINAQVTGFKDLFRGLGKAAREGFIEGFTTGSTSKGTDSPSISSGSISGIGAKGKDKGFIHKAIMGPEQDAEEAMQQLKKLAEELDAINAQIKSLGTEGGVTDKLDFFDTANQPAYIDPKELSGSNLANTKELEKQNRLLRDRAVIMKKLTGILEDSQEIAGHVKEFSDIVHAKKLEQIKAEEEALKTKYDLEEKLVQFGVGTQEEKDKKLKKLAIERAAEEKRLAAENLKTRQQQARFEKAANIASIISATALAVMRVLQDPTIPTLLKPKFAIAAGVTGAIQLAKAAAAPIPQYAKGTDNHKGGLAEVGDGGRKEVVLTPDGKAYVTPAKSTIIDLPEKSKVFPSIEKYLYANPKMPRFTSSSTAPTIIDLNATNNKLDTLNETLKKKNLTVNMNSRDYKKRDKNIW